MVKRYEHCMKCGRPVTIKVKGGKSQELMDHFHGYARHTAYRGMVYAPIICAECLNVPKQSVDDLAAATARLLPEGKPVHRNFSVNVLKDVLPDAYKKAVSYLRNWSLELVPGIVYINGDQATVDKSQNNEAIESSKDKKDTESTRLSEKPTRSEGLHGGVDEQSTL